MVAARKRFLTATIGLDTTRGVCHSGGMEMRRFVWLMAVAGLLLNSLDCYGAWIVSRQARECCNSGRCSPANLTACCKAAPSGAHLALTGQPKVDSQAPVPAVVAQFAVPVPITTAARQVTIGMDLPPPLEFRSSSLPLLI